MQNVNDNIKIKNSTVSRGTCCHGLLYNCRESSTKRCYFMQNKANFKTAELFVNYYLQKDCENEPHLCRTGKQTQTKPILRYCLNCHQRVN